MMKASAASQILLAILAAAGGPASRASEEDFAFRDGDTVAFLGDSITAARDYTLIVEHYTLMRFPGRRIGFINAGQGGDTAEGSLGRIDRDVFDKGASVVVVVFGVNDIGWGMKADEAHKQRYLTAVRTLIERCLWRNVRIVLCSPAITSERSEKAEAGFLQGMSDEGLALAKSLGAGTVDIQRGMREIQKRIEAANAKQPDESKHTRLHVADGVHLNELGHLAMAYAMLKGLGAPAEVSSATIDASTGAVVSAEGCDITGVATGAEGVLTFTRLDEALPLNRGIFSAFSYVWVPVPEGLNRYLLKVTHLPDGEYEIRAGGRSLGKTTATALNRGVNLSSMTADGWQPGGPWDAQSGLVKELTEARDRISVTAFLRSRFAADHPESEALDRLTGEIDEQIVALQRASAKPYPYRFEIRRAEVEGKAEGKAR